MSFRPSGPSIDTLRRIRHLPRRELRGLFRAYVGLAVIDLLLRLRGFRHVASLHAPEAAQSMASMTPEQRCGVQRYVRWIDTASRYHLLPARCLHRSLLLQRWLCHDGFQSELRIGVRREQHALQAHAWVELDGQVVNDSPASVAEFAPLQGLGRLRNGQHLVSALTRLRSSGTR